MAKLITAREAAEMIQDGDAIICATFGASGVPEDIYMELEKRFLETGHPRSLTYTHAAGSGSFAALADENGFCRGEDHICHTGMKTDLATHLLKFQTHISNDNAQKVCPNVRLCYI